VASQPPSQGDQRAGAAALAGRGAGELGCFRAVWTGREWLNSWALMMVLL